MSSTSRILELANIVQASTAKVDAYLYGNNLPSPSFDEDGPIDFGIKSTDVESARAAAIAASIELQDLLSGPTMTVRPVLNGAPLGAIYKYDMPSKVPLKGEVSFEELAKMCGLHEQDVRRLVRFAMVYHRVFQEKRAGFVSHTAASRNLLENPQAMMGVGSMFSEGSYQAFAHILDALEKYRDFEPTGTGWNIANQTDKPIYQYYQEHPELGRRFAGAMATFTKGFGLGPGPLIKGYDWSTVGGGKGKVVDLGGSTGHTSIAIAQANPGLSFVVQELPEMVNKLKTDLLDDVKGRIDYMAHDFFQPQPVEADVYFFRQIFHNWPDPSCVEILRALVPALKPGAKVVANDHLVPPPGTMPLLQERAIRDMDLIMMGLFNSREREVRDWEQLFEHADSRFTDVRVWMPEGSSLCIVEATWSG